MRFPRQQPGSDIILSADAYNLMVSMIEASAAISFSNDFVVDGSPTTPKLIRLRKRARSPLRAKITATLGGAGKYSAVLVWGSPVSDPSVDLSLPETGEGVGSVSVVIENLSEIGRPSGSHVLAVGAYVSFLDDPAGLTNETPPRPVYSVNAGTTSYTPNTITYLTGPLTFACSTSGTGGTVSGSTATQTVLVPSS